MLRSPIDARVVAEEGDPTMPTQVSCSAGRRNACAAGRTSLRAVAPVHTAAAVRNAANGTAPGLGRCAHAYTAVTISTAVVATGKAT